MVVKKIILISTLLLTTTNIYAFSIPNIGNTVNDAVGSASSSTSNIGNTVNDAVGSASSSGLDKTIPSIITGDFTIDMFTTIDKDVIIDGGSLKLDVNVDMKGFKIIATNAKSIILGVNSNANIITGSVANFTMDTNSEAKNVSLSVSESSTLKTNITINEIALKTKNLIITTNATIEKGNIYVYNNFEGGVNSGFNGKLTVYGNTSLKVNSNIEGKFCSLGKVGIGINSNITSFELIGLIGNIDPVLNVNIKDDSEEYTNIKKMTDEFDSTFGTIMNEISEYNKNILNLKTSIIKASDDDKINIQKQLDLLLLEKQTTKDNFYTVINTIFMNLESSIDTETENLNLFNNIKSKYLNAVEFEDASFVDNICNNAEIDGDINSVYEKGNKIIFGNKSYNRVNSLSNKQITTLEKTVSKLDNKKLAKVKSKIDTINKQILKGGNLKQKDILKVNKLLDLDEIIENELLY